ncbi:unnamed protein product, partial [Allacma fusca]
MEFISVSYTLSPPSLRGYLIDSEFIKRNNNCRVWVTGVQINKLQVPALVKNGTDEFIILDCDYNLSDTEKEGLVVKWFFNGSINPVYQWIPPKKPQGLGLFASRLDLTYKASEDPYKMYRALRILRPSVELTGDYKCRVSTFSSEAYKSAAMLVY